MERGISTPRSGLRETTWILTALFVLSTVVPILVLTIASASIAQIPLLDALDPDSAPSNPEADATPAGDPLLAIENTLAEARQRLTALERAREGGDPAQPSVALELSARLIRVLEERREAQIRTNNLDLGRSAIESGLARDPSELFGVPPPFPVPILDGVLQSWRREVEQESKHRTVLDDRQANLRLANEVRTRLEKDRRRLKDILERESDELERIRLQTELRGLNDQLLIAKEQAALAQQRVVNATIEHDIKGIATRQARAALAWVEAHLAPRETDLADAIERLDRERFELDRKIDLARSRLVASEGTLQATEERRASVGSRDEVEFDLELSTRRKQLSVRQLIVALLNQRIERLGRMRTTWQRRYAVLSNRLDLEEAPGWRDAAENELDRHTRMRRIHETELAQLQLELASLIREVTTPDPETPNAPRWLKLELEDLELLAELYQTDLSLRTTRGPRPRRTHARIRRKSPHLLELRTHDLRRPPDYAG